MAGLSGTALESVIHETVRLFHRLRWEAQELYQLGALSSGLVGVLKSLQGLGPQTVPQMARARPVSRQYIQSLVNDLAAKDYVKFIDNPAHKRSSLVRLTRRGEARLEAVARLESKMFGGMKVDIAEKDLREAENVLRNIREFFESKEWQQRHSRVQKTGSIGPNAPNHI